jgi:hypothetical protein
VSFSPDVFTSFIVSLAHFRLLKLFLRPENQRRITLAREPSRITTYILLPFDVCSHPLNLELLTALEKLN